MLLNVRDLGNIVNSMSPRQQQLAFPPWVSLFFPLQGSSKSLTGVSEGYERITLAVEMR